MWLKKMFTKAQLPPVEYAHSDQSQQFQIEEDEGNESPLIDNSPDLRYKETYPLAHGSTIRFPLSMLHETEVIFFQELNLFNARLGDASEWQQVNILASDRQLMISPNVLQNFGNKTMNYFSLSYGWVQKSEIMASKNKKQSTRMKITLKDGRELQLKCVLGDFVTKLNDWVTKFSFPTGINKFYAFRYGQLNAEFEKQYRGWQVYQVKREFARQGLKTSDQNNGMALKYIDNRGGEICSTYPEWLVVPSKITDQQIKKCSSFRTKERLPSLTYVLEYSQNKHSMLFRCSQNKVGILSSRCKEDEMMMQYIGNLSAECIGDSQAKKNCKIYDARGYYAALGNMFAGKGYEKPEFYENCEIQWLDIPNIHAVRQSYNMMMGYNSQSSNYFELCSQSGWYDYLYLIISGAKSVARDLLSGINVVVHCSDGWDRTSQLCAIAQLMIDPYYRTIEGFMVLVEKDWRHFGHKFRMRTGQYKPVDYHPYEKSQIFIQFLDCIFQIINQFPMSFEYNERLLHFLANNVDSNVYGTFMTNNTQEAKSLKIQQCTISIWSYIRSSAGNFKNPYYNCSLGECQLNVATEAKNVRIWKSLFLGDGVSNDIEYHLMRQSQKINETLRQTYYKNQQTLAELKKEIQKLSVADK